MNHFLPYAQTAGVLILAIAGVLFGRRASKARWPLWGLAYIVPLSLTLAIAVARWTPRLEFMIPFRWIMADRTEFAVFAFLTASILTIPVVRLSATRQRLLVNVFMWLAITVYSIFPFLMPGLNYTCLRDLKTTVDINGVCIQSNDYNCGPAAAVTALRRVGIPAEEGELAILAHTTHIAGTPADSLCSAISRRYQGEGIRCTFLNYRSVSDLKRLPVIAVVKHGFLVDHYVTILAVTDMTVQIGDPLEGAVTLTHRQFEDRWRKCGLLIEKVALPK